MKRIGLVCLGLALGAANTVHAQGLTMQMGNGWNFTFSGNVNAFLYYEKSNTGGTTVTPGGLTPGGGAVSATRITTGLLPAFAVFDAKGKEGNTDLGVHFGFAPQVNCATGVNDCFGAQIDMRQVYLTAGGTWGSLLMGKELGLYQRGNILTDMTLLGVGVGGGGRGTALGRIGYGYLYTDFRPQLTYTSPSGKDVSLSIGLFEGLRDGQFTVIELPRVEAELNYNSKFGENSSFKLFLNGAVQTAKDGVSGTTSSLTSAGGGAGFTVDASGFALTGSGFYAKGMGYLLQGDGIVGGGNFNNQGVDVVGKGRSSFGYIGQITYSPPSSKFMIGGSFGENHLRRTDADKTADGITAEILKNRAIIGQITYKWTKSLRWVVEYGHIDGYADGTKASKSDQGSVGMMLFF